MDTTNEYVFTDDEKAMLKGFTDQISAIQADAQVVLKAIVRLRGLNGDGWTLGEDRLTRQVVEGQK